MDILPLEILSEYKTTSSLNFLDFTDLQDKGDPQLCS